MDNLMINSSINGTVASLLKKESLKVKNKIVTTLNDY